MQFEYNGAYVMVKGERHMVLCGRKKDKGLPFQRSERNLPALNVCNFYDISFVGVYVLNCNLLGV